MSKKHFIALAAEIARIVDPAARRAAAEAVAAVARRENDRYDAGRFYAACGVSF